MATSVPDKVSYEATKSCVQLFGFVELCIFLCFLVLFVMTLANRLAGDIFRVEGFPLQRPD